MAYITPRTAQIKTDHDRTRCSHCQLQFTNVAALKRNPWKGDTLILTPDPRIVTPDPRTAGFDPQAYEARFRMQSYRIPSFDVTFDVTFQTPPPAPDPMQVWIAEEERAAQLDAALAELAARRVSRADA